MTDRQRLESFLKSEIELYMAETRFRDHEDSALKNVCHVIVWVSALDELHTKLHADAYRRWRDGEPAGPILKGLRFARHRGVHQFTQMLGIARGGIVLPAPLPAPFFEIVWRPSSELPPPDPEHAARNAPLQAAYDARLAGWPVRFSFDAALELLLRAP